MGGTEAQPTAWGLAVGDVVELRYQANLITRYPDEMIERAEVSHRLDRAGRVVQLDDNRVLKLLPDQERDRMREVLVTLSLPSAAYFPIPMGWCEVLRGNDRGWGLVLQLHSAVADGAHRTDDPIELAGLMLIAVRGLHGRGLAHLDLKPENLVRIGTAPFLRIIDLGSARACDPERAANYGASCLLDRYATTPSHAAPEEGMALARCAVTPGVARTDQWKLAAVVATQLHPGTTTAAAVAQVKRSANQLIARPFELVLARALADDPAARYPDLTAMIRAMFEAGVGREVPFALPGASDAVRARIGAMSFTVAIARRDDNWSDEAYAVFRYLADEPVDQAKVPITDLIATCEAVAFAVVGLAGNRSWAFEANQFARGSIERAHDDSRYRLGDPEWQAAIDSNRRLVAPIYRFLLSALDQRWEASAVLDVTASTLLLQTLDPAIGLPTGEPLIDRVLSARELMARVGVPRGHVLRAAASLTVVLEVMHRPSASPVPRVTLTSEPLDALAPERMATLEQGFGALLGCPFAVAILLDQAPWQPIASCHRTIHALFGDEKLRNAWWMGFSVDWVIACVLGATWEPAQAPQIRRVLGKARTLIDRDEQASAALAGWIGGEVAPLDCVKTIIERMFPSWRGERLATWLREVEAIAVVYPRGGPA